MRKKMLSFRPNSVSLVLVLLLLFAVSSDGKEDNRGKPEGKGEVPLFKISDVSRRYGKRLQRMMSRAHAYLFPPNLDFRHEDDEGSGMGKKVKEATAKSFKKSKETVEETARSAAEAAGEALHETTKKVKESLPGQPRGEL